MRDYPIFYHKLSSNWFAAKRRETNAPLHYLRRVALAKPRKEDHNTRPPKAAL